MRPYRILLLLCTMTTPAGARVPPVPEMKKNVISLEGEFVVIAGNFCINYERILTTQRKFDLGLKGGAGRYFYSEYEFYMMGPVPAIEDRGIRTNTIAKLSIDFIWPRG